VETEKYTYSSIDGVLRERNFTIPFEIHIDSSDYQLGGVVSQRGKPIAFFSRKLNSAQANYTATDKELLGIVETLKEFRYIVMGHRIILWSYHLVLCRLKTEHYSQRVMRQRLLLEEYGAEIRHIQGENNVVADTLSRLEYDDELSENLDCFVSTELDGMNDF